MARSCASWKSGMEWTLHLWFSVKQMGNGSVYFWVMAAKHKWNTRVTQGDIADCDCSFLSAKQYSPPVCNQYNSIVDTAAIYHLFCNITKREKLLNLPTVFRGMMWLHVQTIVCKLFSFKNCWISIILSQYGVQHRFFMFITLKNFSEVPGV